MIAPELFIDTLRKLGVTFYTGVPDSLLQSLCRQIELAIPPEDHVIAANEGNAVALAIGAYLAGGQPALVYLQNSGIGNAINPLLSLADSDVYGVPMLLLIGWRGQPEVHDEPQHVKQGRIMDKLLDTIGLPWVLVPEDGGELPRVLEIAVATTKRLNMPYALLVEKGSFGKGPERVSARARGLNWPSREDALIAAASAFGADDVCVATTGMLGRELFELRVRETSNRIDFLTVGGMGHASSIALGIAMRDQKNRNVWCLDGDGALLMHMGAMATITAHAPPTFNHILFNNGVHDSVGGQPTSIEQVDIPALARAVGYKRAIRVDNLQDIAPNIALICGNGPSLLEIRVKPGSRADIGRPTSTPRDSKQRFMQMLRGDVH